MTAARARPLLIAVILATSLVAAGCGNATKTETSAKTEGLYLNVGNLIYQVQISRQLNQRDVEDRTYLEGLSAADRRLAPDHSFFGIFLRVQNNTNSAHAASNEFDIEDTQGNKFTPIPLPASNPFAYQAGSIPGGGLLPPLESAAANGPVQQGAMLLFKLSLTSLANRPLELRIVSPDAPPSQASVDLDI